MTTVPSGKVRAGGRPGIDEITGRRFVMVGVWTRLATVGETGVLRG
jgi:hypothetical protein